MLSAGRQVMAWSNTVRPGLSSVSSDGYLVHVSNFSATLLQQIGTLGQLVFLLVYNVGDVI